MDDEQLTRKSLLLRLKQGSGNRDWELFYAQYSRVILCFCQQRGLDESSARDVLQETMILVIRKLPGFEYDSDRGRFRNWLLTLVAGKVRDAFRRAERSRTISLDDKDVFPVGPKGLDVPADDGNAAQAVESAWMQSLVHEALLRIERDHRTKPESLAVFRALVLEGRTVAEVSETFRLQPNAIYQIKDRVMKRLRDEIEQLERPLRANAQESAH